MGKVEEVTSYFQLQYLAKLRCKRKLVRRWIKNGAKRYLLIKRIDRQGLSTFRLRRHCQT